MATKPVDLVSNSWVKVYSGPTAKPISVEKQTGATTVWLATGTDVPTFTNLGCSLPDEEPRLVTLTDGENLYAYCTVGKIYTSPNKLIITD